MKVVIIGNGVAGNTASSVIRRLDPQTDITIISEEGFPHYSACALPSYLAGQLKRSKLFLRTRKDYSREGVKIVLGQRVTNVSPENRKVFLDSKSLTYDRLIIATGSRPAIPPIPGVNLNGVFPLKSLADADQIHQASPKAAVIVGSGPIGVEAAIALSKRGVKVYLIELLNRILPRVFDEKPASLLRAILERRGIVVLTNEGVSRIAGTSQVEGVVTSKRQLDCQLVIISAGMKPNIELAQRAGANIGKLGGISVDTHMVTSVGDIYACGDCVETEDQVTGGHTLSLLWHNAREQGQVAGHNCSGVAKVYAGSINLTSLDIFGTHAVSVGIIEAETQPGEVESIERSANNSYHRLILLQGRLVGIQAIGDTRDTGALLYALLRKDSLTNSRQLPRGGPLTPLVLREYGIASYGSARQAIAQR